MKQYKIIVSVFHSYGIVSEAIIGHASKMEEVINQCTSDGYTIKFFTQTVDNGSFNYTTVLEKEVQ